MKWLLRQLEGIGSPLDLAVLRIVVPFVVLGTPEFRELVEYSALPPTLRIVPLGFQSLLSLIPPTVVLGTITKTLLWITLVSSILGLFTRVSLTLATVLALYGLGLAQLQGTVTHNHHLVWFLALLAASPCADVLSIDAWRKTRQTHLRISWLAPPTRAHSVAMATAWVLIAIIFFFPGFWKVRTSGWAWTSSDHFRLLMYWKWYQFDKLPIFRIDHYPRFCQFLATLAVVFEWTIGPLLLIRRTRPFAVLSLLGFHAFTYVFLYIRYPSLWSCYVMFIDWRAVVRFLQDKAKTRKSPETTIVVPSPSLVPILCVAAILTSGSVVFGALGVQRGWPFACYPTFEFKPATVIPRLYIELVFDGDRVEELTLPREASASRSQKQWGISWSLAGVTNAVDEKRLRAWVEGLEQQPELRGRFQGARAVRVYRAAYSVFPEAWHQPPLQKVLLTKWDRT